jgi:hypothetical protein
MKNKTPIIIVFIFAIIALMIYLFKDKLATFFSPKAPAPVPTSTGSNNTTTTIIKYEKDPNEGIDDVPAITDLDLNLLLKKGSKGPEVKKLQSMINQVLKFKKKKAISTDGSFGPNTENALYFLIKNKQTTISNFSTIMVKSGGKGL